MYSKGRLLLLTLAMWPWMGLHAQTINLTANLATSANTPESSVAAEMSNICTRLAALTSRTPEQTQLQSACTQLGDASNDFAERVNGLVAISAKVSTAQITTVTRTSFGDQGNLIDQRLNALRRGLEDNSLSGLSPYINDQQLAGHPVASLTGGAAGDSGAIGLEPSTLDFDLDALSVYLNGNIAVSEQTTTSHLAGFEADAFAVLGGADYRFDDQGIAGVAINYLSNDLDLAFNQGQLEGQGFGLIAYGNYFPAEHWYLEGSVHAGSGSFDMSRNVAFTVNNITFSEIANSSTDASETGLAFGGGYDTLLKNGALLEVSGQFSYSSSEIDGYSETGGGGFNLNVTSQEVEQTLITVAAQLSKAIGTTRGVIIPHVRAAFIVDLSADEQTITADFVSDPGNAAFSFTSPSRDSSYLELAAGGSLYLAGGGALFAQLETLQLIDDYEQLTVSFGYRQEL